MNLTFENPIVEKLYEVDFFIDQQLLTDILALKGSIEPDLLKIIVDMTENFDKKFSNNAIDFYKDFYFMHAVYLLADLEHEPLLDHLLKWLSTTEEGFMEFWFADTQFEEINGLVSQVGINQIPKLIDFVTNAKVSLLRKSYILGALSQIAHFFPAKRQEIIAFLKNYFHTILSVKNKKELSQKFRNDDEKYPKQYGHDAYEYVGILTTYIADYDLFELEEEVKQCFDRGFVNEFTAGDWEEYEFVEDPTFWGAKSIMEKYDELLNHMGDESPYNPDYEELKIMREKAIDARIAKLQEIRAKEQELEQLESAAFTTPQPKIGRNDPCPCESGKKYKKCCGA